MQVFQRQLSKEGLQQVVNSNASASAEGEQGGGLSASAMSSDELRDLFTLRTLTLSDTYDSMCADDDSDVDVDGVEGGPAPKEAICREQASSAAIAQNLQGRNCMHSLPCALGLVHGNVQQPKPVLSLQHSRSFAPDRSSAFAETLKVS